MQVKFPKLRLFHKVLIFIAICLFVLIRAYYKHVSENIKFKISTFFVFSPDPNIYNDFSQDVLIESHAPKKYAIISTALVANTKYFYLMYIPICAIAWRRIGYEPIVLIVNNPKATVSQVANRTIEYLNRLKVRIVYVQAPLDHIDQLGQLARLYSGALSDDVIKDEDFILTTDSDMIPVSHKFFNQYNTKAITILNAHGIGTVNHKGKQYDMVPMMFIGMRKWQWREVMRLPKDMVLNGENIMKNVMKINDGGVFRKNKDFTRGDDVWYLDQNTVTIAIYEYLNDDKFKSERKLNKYKYTGMRLDRGDSRDTWYRKLNSFDLITDAHMFHGDSKDYLKRILDFLEILFNKKIYKQLNAFIHELLSYL
jgi:hypothetical protein